MDIVDFETATIFDSKELIEMANNVLSEEKEIVPQPIESDIFDELR